MTMIAPLHERPLDTRTWDAFARLLDKAHGAGSAPAAGAPGFHPRTETSSSAEGGRREERLVGEGNADAALVFDGDLAAAWCQFGAVADRARRQLPEIDQIVPPPVAR